MQEDVKYIDVSGIDKDGLKRRQNKCWGVDRIEKTGADVRVRPRTGTDIECGRDYAPAASRNIIVSAPHPFRLLTPYHGRRCSRTRPNTRTLWRE